MNLMLQQKKKKLVQFLLDNNVLVEPDFFEKLAKTDDPLKISELVNEKISITSKEQVSTSKPKKRESSVKVQFSYNSNPKKISVQDFINYFNARYGSLKKMLQLRPQLENVSSIGKLKTRNEREQVSLIGMVSEKEDTKNGIMLTLEDPTGPIKVFFSKNKQDLFSKAKDVVHDEVIGVTGSLGKNIVFGNDLFFPDIPATKELKKSPEEEYAVFISDLHVGSTFFLEEEFLKFLNWLQGKEGSEKQREIASKVKYVFLTGDAVDGISIHPTQKEDLNIFTFKGQYKKVAEYLKMIPSDIKIIIGPGNHDIVHIAEPQPPIPEDACQEIYNMPNVTMVSNPALVNIGAREGFSGFDVLMYHGYSFNYYADKVESIRIQKPNISERADLVLKMFLQKRHLAPTYDGNPHLATDIDHLIIEKIPDIIISGDVHRSAIFTYKNVITGIISSCFQAKTSFQEKVGHVPDPGRVPILNLQTREAKILNFSKEEDSK